MKRLIFVAAILIGVVVLLVPSLAQAQDWQAKNPDGSKRWVLSVTAAFSPSDVQAIGGKCVWHWREAGIAVASSFSETFMQDADRGTVASIQFAVPDFKAQPPKPRLHGQAGSPVLANSFFDAYANNLQWYLQAIGAVRPEPGTNDPMWQLGDYEGSGVTVGFVDTGAPAVWIDGDPTNALPHPEVNEFDPAHPENGGVVYVYDNGNILNIDDAGHGTATAGLLAAQHRGIGAMRGLAPKAKTICYKVDLNDFLGSALAHWWQASIDRPQILNNSWIGWDLPVEVWDGVKVKLPKVFRSAAAELHRQGVLVVASMGNDPINLTTDFRSFSLYWDKFPGAAAMLAFPAELPNVIGVGGTAPKDYDPYASDLSIYNPIPGTASGGQKGREYNLDRVSNFYISEWDLTYGSSYGASMNLVAPEGGWEPSRPDPDFLYDMIYTPAPWIWPGIPDLHDYWIGTSFSGPFTCGVAALAAEAYYRTHGKKPSPTTLATILMKSADDLVGPATDDLWVWKGKTGQYELQFNVVSDRAGKDERYGTGRVNAVRAIQLALALKE